MVSLPVAERGRRPQDSVDRDPPCALCVCDGNSQASRRRQSAPTSVGPAVLRAVLQPAPGPVEEGEEEGCSGTEAGAKALLDLPFTSLIRPVIKSN